MAKERRRHDEAFVRFLTRERAADIISFAFRGKAGPVRAEDLEPFSTKSADDDGSMLRRRERDFLHKCYLERGSGTGFIFIGIENQLRGDDASFLFRAMRYDADELERQLLRDGRIRGVITVCVYSGTGEWRSPTTVFSALDEETRGSAFFPLMFDYGYYLIDLHKLTDEETSMLRSEWRLFPPAIKAKDMEELGKVLSGVEYQEADWETQMMLAQCVGNEWIMDYIEKRRDSTMSNVMREYEKRVNERLKESDAKIKEYDDKVKEYDDKVKEYDDKVNEMSNVMKAYDEKVSELSSDLEKTHVATAKKMLRKGFSHNDVSDISGLALDEVERLALAIAEKEPEYSAK